MVGSSSKRRNRARQFWTATLCAAGFVTGQWLFGQQPAPSAGTEPTPQSITNPFLPARSASSARPSAAGPRPVEIEPVSDVPAAAPASVEQPRLVEARPLVVLNPTVSQPAQKVAQTSTSQPQKKPAVAQAIDQEETLAPIVPAWAMPAKGNRAPASKIQKAAMTAADAPRELIPDAEASVISAPRRGVATAEFDALQPAAQPPAPDASGILPPGSPFEAIPQSGEILLRVRRSLLLRTKVDVYRTAIVDEAVCDIVQFTPREVSIIGRSLGQTHVTFWFDDPATPPLTYLVKVEPDATVVKQIEDKYKLLQDVVNEMFPDSKVYLFVVADKLLVKGQAKDSEEAAQIMNIIRVQGVRGAYGLGGAPGWGGVADVAATPVLSQAATGGNPGPALQIINMLRVPGVQQVALKVKIADLNRTAARGFGVDLNAAIDLNDSIEGSRLFLASLLNASATGGTSLLTTFSGDDVSIGIRYLQERGVVKLLSEPTLVTLSGRPATFIAGGEFAVPTVVGSVGLNAVTTDFRAFGAIISFLPTIVDKDRIRLQVAPEFSSLNRANAVGGTPGLNVRAATTTVEMREGQTLAIAGLIEDSFKATNIGDLPGLAKIFGRRDTSRSETELIILVTPELVHPLDPEEVPPLPGFDVTEPTACEFFFCGEIEGNPTRDYRSTVWPRLRKRYGMGGPAMTSGAFGHGQ